MKLLTKEILKALPALYTTEAIPLEDKVVVCKFFDPCGSYTFYIVEGTVEEEDTILWGYVTGLGEPEWGYSSLNEIKGIRTRFGLGIERDIHWSPRKVSEVPDIKIRR